MWIERERLKKEMVELVDDCQDRWDKEKVVVILDVACIDERIGRSLEPQRGCGQEDLCNPQILIILIPFCIITHHILLFCFYQCC